MKAITRKRPAEGGFGPSTTITNPLVKQPQSAEFVPPKVIKTVRKRYVDDVLPETANRVFRKSTFEYGLIIIICPYSKIL